MSDVEETESLADRSFYILNNKDDQRAQNFNIFQQHKQHSQSMSERPQLIQHPNQFPQISTSMQHNESIGFLTQRSNLSQMNQAA